MIIWIPDATGLWRPENQHKVFNSGSEVEIDFVVKTKKYFIHSHLNYTYTKSIPQLTDGTEYQQIYVPKHKVAYSITTGYKNYYITYNQVINSKLYLDPQNTRYLPISSPVNLEIGRTINLPSAKINVSFGCVTAGLYYSFEKHIICEYSCNALTTF